MNTKTMDVSSPDYWFKVVDMGQQNWALITPDEKDTDTALFISDTSGVFDRLSFPTTADAAAALTRNGFARYAEDQYAQDFIRPPSPPYREKPHPNGPIYSSGRFWE